MIFQQNRKMHGPETPEQVERKRAMAAALMQQNQAPAGDFLGAVVQGLRGFQSGRMERNANRAEAEGMTSADGVIGALMNREPTSLAPSQGGQYQQAPQADVSGAFAGSVANSGQFPASLIRTESGGNWNALNSEGYGGRLQFGTARLADAARAGVIPAGMTGAEFSRLPPEQQSAVENWHFADIDRQTQRLGLDQFIGQNIGGTQITQDGIRAMAHLGGIGGAQKFLQSGGAVNPADSNGTSLADYARTHGGSSPVAPIAGAGSPPPTGVSPMVSALMQAQGNPWVAKKYGGVLDALMQQDMKRQDATYQQQLAQQDPMYQAQLQSQQMQNQAMMNPPAQKPVYEGGQWWDTSTGVPTALTDPLQDQTSAVQNYEYLISQGVPKDEAQAQAFGGGGVTVNNQLGLDKFDEAFAKGDADAIGAISASGMAAQRNMGRIDQLESLLTQSPSGFGALAAQKAGEWGINTEGLDTIQAAQAAINSLVPEQRQPGSGPMSDADLDLFKQSLPRIINQPGGNQLIIQTMRSIAQYDADGAQITQMLRAGEIDRAQAFDMLQNRTNPLASFQAPPAQAAAQDMGATPAQRRRYNPQTGAFE